MCSGLMFQETCSSVATVMCALEVALFANFKTTHGTVPMTAFLSVSVEEGNENTNIGLENLTQFINDSCYF